MRSPLAIAIGAAIALAILIAVCWRELVPAPAAGPEGGIGQVESASEPTADATSGARIDHDRERARREAASSRPGDPSHALVLGRCLAAEDGAPLPGCRLTI